MEYTDEMYYGTYFMKLRRAQDQMLATIYQLLEEITKDAEHAPVEHIRSRIKSMDSTREKLSKLGYSQDVRSALIFLSDIVGVRIVTHFVGDVYSILDKLQKDSGWKIAIIKDYISNPKLNGYRSLHVIFEIPFEDEEIPSIMTEIQLRTIAMDCWASLEHQMKYKKNISNEALIESELKRCADEIASTDLSMETIREMLFEQ